MSRDRDADRDSARDVDAQSGAESDGAESDEAESDEALLDPRRRAEEETKRAWGSWRQDREQNRRKVLRSLLWLVVVVTATSLLAYGCALLRGPEQLRLRPVVAGFTLAAPSDVTEQLQGSFEAAGATGPAAGLYTRPGTAVLFVVGKNVQLPTDVLAGLLPPVTAAGIVYPGRGGPMDCGPTAAGSRCVWKSGDLVGGTSASGIAPAALEQVSRDLRAGAVAG